MTQLSLWERTNEAIDSYFPVASAKASTLPRAHATQARRAQSAGRRSTGLVWRLHEIVEAMSDAERYGELPERIDPQTGYLEEQ